MNILVIGHYIFPDQEINPRTILYTAVCNSIEDAVKFIRDNFDGKETFNEYYAPEITEHLSTSTEEYALDDWSAGQWFYVRVLGNPFEKVEEIQP